MSGLDLLTDLDLRPTRAPAKRWWSEWCTVDPCTVAALNKTMRLQPGECFRLGPFPSFEVAEQNARDVMNTPPRAAVELLRICPDTDT